MPPHPLGHPMLSTADSKNAADTAHPSSAAAFTQRSLLSLTPAFRKWLRKNSRRSRLPSKPLHLSSEKTTSFTPLFSSKRRLSATSPRTDGGPELLEFSGTSKDRTTECGPSISPC